MENDGSAVVGLEVFEPVDPNQISDAIAIHVFFVNVIAISGTATSMSVIYGINKLVYLKYMYHHNFLIIKHLFFRC